MRQQPIRRDSARCIGTVCVAVLTAAALLAGPPAGAQEEEGAPAAPQPGEERSFQGIEFVWCPPGSYEQGSAVPPKEVAETWGGHPAWFTDEHPRHTVTITKGFWLSKYEITRAQWVSGMKTRPWERFGGDGEDSFPAAGMTWTDCGEFVKTLTVEGQGVFRLPTEAEWEYACRAGTDSIFFFGDDPAPLGEYVHHRFGDVTADAGPVGQKKPDAWGLHDMLGNVWEWCDDPYAPYGDSPAELPEEFRVIRGGSVNSTAAFLRCAYRLSMPAAKSAPHLGLRVVREP